MSIHPAARSLRADILVGRTSPSIASITALERAQLGVISEHDLQERWVAIARHEALASIHARTIAVALVALARKKQLAAVRKGKRLPPIAPWMLAVAHHRGPWLPGGRVTVDFSSVGNKLVGGQGSRNKQIGMMEAVPDLLHTAEFGVTWRAEAKRPALVVNGRKRRKGVLRTEQREVLKALTAAGHLARECSTLVELGTLLLEAFARRHTTNS